MSELTKEEVKAAAKEAYKEGLKEWLDEKFASFGLWSFRALLASFLAALTWFTFHMNDLKGLVKQ